MFHLRATIPSNHRSISKNILMQNETKRKLAEKVIDRQVLMSVGCGAIPIPLLDMAAVFGIKKKMIRDLCLIYEVEFNEHIAKSLLASTVGTIGRRMGASFFKSIPFIGSVIGGVASATLSGVSTYAMGHAFMRYMEVNASVKSLKDIDTKVFGSLFDSISKQAETIKERIKGKVGVIPSEEPVVARQESILAYGTRAFGGYEKFQDWLKKPNSFLSGEKPMSLMLSEKEEDQSVLRRLIQLHFEETKSKVTA